MFSIRAKKSSVFFIAPFLFAAFFFASPVLANNGKGKGHKHEKSSSGDNGIIWSGKAGEVAIGLEDRQVIQTYIKHNNQKRCPPGLAKKHNGCLPPGIAKKYNVGERLPDDVALMPVPDDLLKLLSPAPKGYMYARVDKDVLLVAEASKKVVDAVTLLSAVGK
jgi:hypothetical protein